MCVDAGVSRRACQVLVLSVRYMLMRLGVAVLLCQAEVDHVHQVTLLAKTHQEIIGLNVTMNEVLRVYVFDAAYLRQKQTNFITTAHNDFSTVKHTSSDSDMYICE